jgi:Glyoxalase-like domain
MWLSKSPARSDTSANIAPFGRTGRRKSAVSFSLSGLMIISLRLRLLPLVLLLLVVCAEAGELQDTQSGPPIIGIDHIPLVVKNLGRAIDAYMGVGFSLKPGRLHGNGIRNSHVKFKDGSGVELLSPPSESKDALTAHYLEHLKQGDGPAYISFHARDTGKLIAVLNSSGFASKNDGTVTLDDPELGFIFFVKDNRSPTDKPEHFVHPNSTIAITSVWLALDGKSRKSLSKMLTALGAVTSEKTVFAPDAIKAAVFTVQNGQIVVLPKNHQLRANRPVIGATFRIPGDALATSVTGDRRRLLVSPSNAHGLWLDFREGP